MKEKKEKTQREQKNTGRGKNPAQKESQKRRTPRSKTNPQGTAFPIDETTFVAGKPQKQTKSMSQKRQRAMTTETDIATLKPNKPKRLQMPKDKSTAKNADKPTTKNTGGDALYIYIGV